MAGVRVVGLLIPKAVPFARRDRRYPIRHHLWPNARLHQIHEITKGARMQSPIVKNLSDHSVRAIVRSGAQDAIYFLRRRQSQSRHEPSSLRVKSPRKGHAEKLAPLWVTDSPCSIREERAERGTPSPRRKMALRLARHHPGSFLRSPMQVRNGWERGVVESPRRGKAKSPRLDLASMTPNANSAYCLEASIRRPTHLRHASA